MVHFPDISTIRGGETKSKGNHYTIYIKKKGNLKIYFIINTVTQSTVSKWLLLFNDINDIGINKKKAK